MSEIRFTAPTSRETSDLHALLFQEWKLCRGSVVPLATIWVIGLWMLVIFRHPGWLLATGVAYIMNLSAVQGGRDTIDGTEEFSFTLPPGRGPLFLARIFPGFVFLTINGLLGCSAIEYNLPQRLWSLVFSSGLTEPFPAVQEPVWYIAALFAPCAAHAISFTTAALARSRQGVSAAVSVGLIGTAATMLVGWWADQGLYPQPAGFLTGVGLLGVAVLVPAAGYRLYLLKETTVAANDSAGGIRTGFWIVAAIVAAVLLLVFWFRGASVGSVGMDHTKRDRMVSHVPALEKSARPCA